MFRPLLGVVSLILVSAAFAPAEETCSQCHDQTEKIKGSVHAAVGCATCHVKHEEYPHPQVAKPTCAQCHQQIVQQHASSVHGQELKKGNEGAPACATCHDSDTHLIKSTKSAEFRKAVPDTCGMCHTDVQAQFAKSVHGTALSRGITEAPSCTDCHGEHAIQRPSSTQSPVHPSHIRETCASCHGDVRLNRKFNMPGDRVTSFEGSFHGLAGRAGNPTVANCASCHGIHNILPSGDPAAMTNAKNLPTTCGKCHPGTSSRFAMGPVHYVEGRSEPAAIKMVRQFYLLIIPATLGFMLLHNGGDWVRKLRNSRFRSSVVHAHAPIHTAKPEIRMYRFERYEHLLLVLSFVTLTWTGFALKYPDAWWAYPLIAWESQYPVRGTVHRIAAVVFTLVSIAHVISIIVSPKLRDHWKKLWPRYQDIPQAIHSLAYNLSLTNKPPRLPAYNFIEKMEYWAVVWGAVIMGATGVVLWANTFFLNYMPKVFLDVATTIHLYEAILAALAILIWHIYFVIFDPEVYPMQTAWLTGKSVRPHHDPEPERTAQDGGGDERS